MHEYYLSTYTFCDMKEIETISEHLWSEGDLSNYELCLWSNVLVVVAYCLSRNPIFHEIHDSESKLFRLRLIIP